MIGREYKETKIGLIPEDWGYEVLSNISYINRDSLSERTPPDDCFKYIDLSSVTQGKINCSFDEIFFSELPSRARRIIKKHDILLATVRPRLKGFAYIDFDCSNYVVSTGYAVINVHDSYNPKFIYHYLFSKQVEKYFENCVVGSNYPALTNFDVANLPIPLPPLPEQKKIAEILSTWDRAIEKTEKLIVAKNKLKKGLMQQLLTGRKRFNEFEKDKWIIVKLGDVFKERNEIEYSELELLSITGANGVVKRDTIDKIDTSNKDKSKYKRICPGDIGYNTMRMWQGVSGVSIYEGIVSPAYTVVIPQKNVDPSFMGYFFKLSEVVHLFYRHSQGLVDDTLNLKYHHFTMIHVKIPENIKEQQCIASVLSAIDNEISVLNKKLNAIKQQKKGLMQKLLTGQVRVKV